MKKNSIPQFIGVIISFVAIWLVNDFFLVDQCLDNGGSFNYSKGECVLVNGEIQASDLGKYLIAIYFFMGLLIALSVSMLIQKTCKTVQE
ncbi:MULTISPECIES: hypothetical protein [unclassified Colwellia]|uniref:hypothetical protein n=1 Tax=unclassified Colwellia TaxID=196834 RepID=UPI0015F6506A|nr:MULTISPECIES: hypothetical protein [unclassified Colwellia]MBA6348038.1 hypothetical protein [Colwellia sp. BRX8-9]MBA6379210.1 hypothetical protein [Colwellia sp. BRX10-7]MBA6386044.1 hypothetical protein [Colwellia sp. BRX10-2]MBA6401983.1 hypothetical protein [Colwellia sp. BRX10-5]MBA6406867.1 hypothetical protein [Colwellia sp. BRX10-1]